MRVDEIQSPPRLLVRLYIVWHAAVQPLAAEVYSRAELLF